MTAIYEEDLKCEERAHLASGF